MHLTEVVGTSAGVDSSEVVLLSVSMKLRAVVMVDIVRVGGGVVRVGCVVRVVGADRVALPLQLSDGAALRNGGGVVRHFVCF